MASHTTRVCILQVYNNALKGSAKAVTALGVWNITTLHNENERAVPSTAVFPYWSFSEYCEHYVITKEASAVSVSTSLLWGLHKESSDILCSLLQLQTSVNMPMTAQSVLSSHATNHSGNLDFWQTFMFVLAVNLILICWHGQAISAESIPYINKELYIQTLVCSHDQKLLSYIWMSKVIHRCSGEIWAGNQDKVITVKTFIIPKTKKKASQVCSKVKIMLIVFLTPRCGASWSKHLKE